MTSSRVVLLVGVCLHLLLQGCLVPDQYNSIVVIKKESIEFFYKGIIVDSVVAKTLKTKKVTESEAKENTIREMNIMKEKYKKSGVTAEVAYVRPSEFSVSFKYRLRLEPNERHTVFNAIGFQRIGADKLRIETADTTDAHAMEEIAKWGVQSNGTLVVRVEPGIKVLDENANDKPGLLSNDYKWSLTLGALPVRFVVEF